MGLGVYCIQSLPVRFRGQSMFMYAEPQALLRGGCCYAFTSCKVVAASVLFQSDASRYRFERE